MFAMSGFNTLFKTFLRPFGLCLPIIVVGLLTASTAHAQIAEPRAHLRYSLELELHVALQYAHLPGDAAGIGPGLRASIPLLQDGPISSLNNSLALGVGFDWAYFLEPCGAYFWDGPSLTPNDPDYTTFAKDCSAHHFTMPVVVQWNFFLSRIVNLFVEPGMALLHERRSGTGWCNGIPCSKNDYSTTLPFVFWGGARISMSDSMALTIRLGSPYVSAGMSMFF